MIEICWHSAGHVYAKSLFVNNQISIITFLLHTAKAGFAVFDTAGEVNPALHCLLLLPPAPRQLVVVAAVVVADEVRHGDGKQAAGQHQLKHNVSSVEVDHWAGWWAGSPWK